MSLALVLIWSLVLVLCGAVWHRKGMAGVQAGGQNAFATFRSLIIRLPCALIIASCAIQLLPLNLVSDVIGPGSGVLGILLASVVGVVLPGGPMTSFPIAVVLQQGGAGLPQLVALLSGWSLFALQRLLVYEAPLLGWRFAALRCLICVPLPLAAGCAAHVLIARLSGV